MTYRMHHLTDAYVRLVYRPQRACARRDIVLAGQIGSIDVRLTELEPEAGASGQPPNWLEIYSHTRGSMINNCGGFECDEVYLLSAVEMILK